MAELLLRVECYSGCRADERPVRIVFGSQTLNVKEVEDRWYSPGATFFAAWSLTAFRAAGKRVDTKINDSV
jgi:hypothetical protein